MKIRLEKAAVNISKLTGGKNEKARRWFYIKTSVRFIFSLQYWMEIKTTEYVICRQEPF